MAAHPVTAFGYNTFLAVTNTGLGALLGCLIGMPLNLTSSSLFGRASLLLLFTVLGGAIGYRRRHSKVFLYFALLSIVLLASIISGEFSHG